MVAQLGNDRALDEQQQALANLAQQQQALANGAQQPAEQQPQPLGAPPLAMSAAGLRTPSAQSYATADGDEDILSEDSLVVSPEAKRPQRARPGARSSSAPRNRKTSTGLTKPLAGRTRPDTPT